MNGLRQAVRRLVADGHRVGGRPLWTAPNKKAFLDRGIGMNILSETVKVMLTRRGV